MPATPCACGCGQPAVYAARHFRHRRAPTISETDYVKMDCGHSTPCWIWQGVRGPRYRKVRLNGRYQHVHRASYEQFIGPIPDGLHIDHLCRETRCINPRHLEAVTPVENQRRVRSKLVPSAVREIRCSGERAEVLAQHYGVDVSTIYMVRRRATWKEIA